MDMSVLKGKRVLIVDDEPDVIGTLVDELDMCLVDSATDFASAKKLLERKTYDAAVLDVMGVNGYELLKVAVANGVPALMLTAHAVSPDNFKTAILGGAHAYLPKEKMADIADFLAELLAARNQGARKSGRWFTRLLPFFDRAFGSRWKEKDPEFWRDFTTDFKFSKEELEKML